MKNKSTVTFIIAFFFIGLYMGHQASAKPADSLRVGAMMKEMNKLIGTVQDSIIADLKGDEKKKLKGMVSELDKIMKRAGTMFKDTMLADFSKLSDEEKGVLREIESAVLKIRNAVNEKSTDYHLVAKAYIPVYKAA